jgi:predicted acylesterase/phospholipase RssA
MPEAEPRSGLGAASAREAAPAQKGKLKRAIALGGGGPVAGLHIGVLEYLKQKGIEFDVWALSCIGAWVGIIYNTREGDAPRETYEFFRTNIFRDDYSYSVFPINRVFGPDWSENYLAMTAFITDWDNYKNLWPEQHEIKESIARTRAFCTDPSKWTTGDFNQWMLNDVLAMNPVTRFWTSLMYLSHVNGLSKIYYPDSSFLKSIPFDKLRNKSAYIYHNAWDLTEQKLRIFYNRDPEGRVYPKITSASLCACSALPFVEGTVRFDGHNYCEGALVDTVNFKNLLEDHFDLDEIWINRIVDSSQVREPKNLHDSLGNLCELFAATVGEDDVKLFKYHVRYDDIETKEEPGVRKQWQGTIVEIHVDSKVTFKWNHKNLDAGRDHGKAQAKIAHDQYMAAGPYQGNLRLINGNW